MADTSQITLSTPYITYEPTGQQFEHIRELTTIQSSLFNDGVWMGKTAALASAAKSEPRAVEPGETTFTHGQITAYTAGDDLHRKGPDGIELAWSCWDVALTLALAIRETRTFKAFLLDAVGTETGARSEPHAVVGIEHRASGLRYLADPYFEVLPVPQEELVTADQVTPTSKATLRGPRAFSDGTSLLTVQHISYASAYSYLVSRQLGDVAEGRLMDAAPGWTVARNQRVMRTRSGNYTIRVAETGDGESEVKVWDNSLGVGSKDVWRRSFPSWIQAAQAASNAVSTNNVPLLLK